jgi:N-dimethylarginine dimethylaminohydrolase
MKIVMCEPTYYDVEYEINPWMDVHNRPDKKKSFEQWLKLRNTYESLGVEVQLIAQEPGLPDMMFTANGGTVRGNIFVSGNYRYKERKGEEKYFQKWFADHGYEVKTLSHFQGGEGDALFYRDILYMGYGFRSDKEAHAEMAEILQVPTVSFKLIDPYFYDFDTAFCPIGNKAVLYYPMAFSEEDRERVAAIDGAIPMTKEQAEHFVGNSVHVNGKLLVSFLDEDLKEKLSAINITPILLDLSEFKKGGGGIKCLTLYLEK